MSTPLARPNYSRRVYLLLGIVLGFRLLYAAIVPENPAGDEAYYWDWGRHLDYGYYSKPPFIAWLYAFVDWIGNGSLFGIRATAAILGAFSALILYRLTSAMFDERVGWTALIICLAAPASSVLSFFLTIDAPLTLCWSIALWMLWRYISGAGKTGTLVVLFFALGIGHLSKQMMMAFPVLAVALLLLHRDTRPLLKRPGLLLVLFGSYVSLIPPLVWNAQNEWITFTHTQHHFQTGASEGNLIQETLKHFFEFIGSQLGVLSPIFGVVLYWVSLSGLKNIRAASLPVRFLLVFGALPLAGMLILALRQELQPNWPAVFYTSSLILTGAFFSSAMSGDRKESKFSPQAWRKIFVFAATTGFLLSAYFYVSPIVYQAIGKPGHKADPNRRLMAHDDMAAGFEKFRSGQPDSDELFIVTIGHRDFASHLAFALPDQPEVYLWEAFDQTISQYQLWNNPYEDGFSAQDGLILLPGGGTPPTTFSDGFSKVEKLGEYDVSYGYDRSLTFTVFRGFGLKFWPKGSPLPES
tara:strand:+ start:5300 stop:6874 length:1575 start_codon:yes stop_codon:yes gene_type:complete